ncbi:MULTISPECIES: DUF5132 domain-containing protein [unclassified Streptomyces]|uniref:DUF5132 domain-containing protein n=1 Tax=unclassified Streptomyces TaxID=2593676 RepID=UPI002DD8611C|nr:MULTISPECIES: DUF5132 domain-containing protein [unclassified Streptomyces]WSA90370.1 DUF5132 domain-containing protein [Streptomyces sp. NBC_01795]WSB74596.1 DUF5132 domain-containing protein [Streptomyces sp. NBC_01775]WSS17018.1 DUF5132 domain-containing protein [Streptomyces sp. NBC_01186]WSS45762.1 DUF5132 domain-containing protein [Streptomyces sp. NBC_01187]
MPPVFPVFAVGVIAAPFVKKMLRSVTRGAVKTTVKLAADAKRAVHEVNEEISDIAAEASAEIQASEPRGGEGQPQSSPKKRRPEPAKASS